MNPHSPEAARALAGHQQAFADLFWRKRTLTLASPLFGSLLTPAFFHLRQRSLLRANLVVLGSCAAALPLSHFPQLQPSPLLVVPVLLALAGTVDTVRCIRPRWSLYHGAVIFSIYMDLMVLCLVLFLLMYPYLSPLTGRPL